MSPKINPRLLVLRRDTATGLSLVGWDVELPLGRFEHLQLICESANNSLPETGSRDYECWQSAMQRARQENHRILEQQIQLNMSKGWFRVPPELGSNENVMVADSFGSYTTAAMQLHYQLTQNRKRAWAVIRDGSPIHIRARYPVKDLDELTYQVWYQRQLHELNQMDGDALEGDLMICESGLWFVTGNRG